MLDTGAVAKIIAQNTRRLIKAVITAVKTTILATKAFITFLIAGGWIAVVVVLIVCIMGGETYWSWYGFEERVAWCACFVSWTANQCGYIEKGVIPKFSVCTDGIAWFQEKKQWIEATDLPMVGDIIFFDWNDGGQDGVSDHGRISKW